MSTRAVYRSVKWLLLLLLAIQLPIYAADGPVGMLYATGSAWLNGSKVPNSAAVFYGDMLQTSSGSLARINATGTSVMVSSNTLVKVEESKIHIEHGAINVGTSRGLATQAGEITVAPKGNSWTSFQVSEVDGKVQIVAEKGDLTVTDGQTTATLQQGQQTTVEDTNEAGKKKHRKRGTGAAPAASGSIMNSTEAIMAGSGVVAGVTIWVLLQGGAPLSPSCPSSGCP